MSARASPSRKTLLQNLRKCRTPTQPRDPAHPTTALDETRAPVSPRNPGWNGERKSRPDTRRLPTNGNRQKSLVFFLTGDPYEKTVMQFPFTNASFMKFFKCFCKIDRIYVAILESNTQHSTPLQLFVNNLGKFLESIPAAPPSSTPLGGGLGDMLVPRPARTHDGNVGIDS